VRPARVTATSGENGDFEVILDDGTLVREERISYLEGERGGAAGGLRRIHFEGGSSLEREGLFYVPPQRQGSELAQMLGCETGQMGQAPSGVKSDPTTRETSVAGVYVAGDAGNAVQSALLAAASGASAAFFVNHSLVAEEIAAAVGAAGSAAVRRGLRLSGPTRRR
jgi:thioredoxin reductase